MPHLLELTPAGLYCPAADVYIDPWRSVARAIITHGHADHARPGMGQYLTHHDTVPVLRYRISRDISVRGIAYGEHIQRNGVTISLHPAGHITGSAQVRIEHRGEVWVVTGDFKRGADPTADSFEVVPCHTLITESTFGLPIFRWRPQQEVFDEINGWWRENAARGVTSVLLTYALGKAQRILAGLDVSIGPCVAHSTVYHTTEMLRRTVPSLARLPKLQPLIRGTAPKMLRRALLLAAPSVMGTSWLKRLEPYALGVPSGWMAVRRLQRRRKVDRGFVLSDHADWEELNRTVMECGASRVLATHGYSSAFTRWLRKGGIDAAELETAFRAEEVDEVGEADA